MIVCVGDIMVDIFVLSALQEAEQGSGLVLRDGGSAANTASWLARGGAEVTFVGCVGQDATGMALTGEMRVEGVTPRVRVVPQAETGAVLVRVEDDGTERVMRSARGANMDLSPDDIEHCATPDLACVHVTGYALLGPYGLELLEAASRVAGAQDALLSFDPSSPGVINRFGPQVMLDAVKRCQVGLLLPNVEEASALTGEPSMQDALQRLTSFAPTVLLKAGAEGSAFATPSSAGSVSTTARSVLDPTGAGDAFNAGAIAGLLAGSSPAEACRLGMKLAGGVLASYGGRPTPSRRGAIESRK